jgi:hypothetical protein
MKVLSLSNPWPWAIFHPDPAIRKDVENRTWAPPISQIGQMIAIHAAKSWDDSAVSYFLGLGITDFPARKDLYPTGAIVGVATIDRIRTGDPAHPPADCPVSQRKWFFGPYGWFLSDQIALATPIPMKGAQGLRDVPPDVYAQVFEQVAASRSKARTGS